MSHEQGVVALKSLAFRPKAASVLHAEIDALHGEASASLGSLAELLDQTQAIRSVIELSSRSNLVITTGRTCACFVGVSRKRIEETFRAQRTHGLDMLPSQLASVENRIIGIVPEDMAGNCAHRSIVITGIGRS